MLIRSQTTTLLQILCEILLYSQVIFESMKVADDTLCVNGLNTYFYFIYVSHRHIIGMISYNICWQFVPFIFILSLLSPKTCCLIWFNVRAALRNIRLRNVDQNPTHSATFDSCTKCVGSRGIIHDCTPDSHPVSLAWMHRWPHIWTQIWFKATWVVDMLDLYFWHSVSGWLYNHAMADVRSIGARTKCLYCTTLHQIFPQFMLNFIDIF